MVLTIQSTIALYFHENQITYPWSPKDNELSSIEIIKNKSSLLYLGLDLKSLNKSCYNFKKNNLQTPLIIWKHRWEYDKNPNMFFNALFHLHNQNINFDVAVLGESFTKKPIEFEKAKKKLGSRIKQFGYNKNPNAYAQWLLKADIIPVTSKHDFFGASIVQAIYCNCFPILPRRLSYPEHLPLTFSSNYYNSYNGLINKLKWAILNIDTIRKSNFSQFVEKYDWDNLIEKYDDILEKMA